MTNKAIACFSLTETRLDLDPAYPAAVASLRIPHPGSEFNPLSPIQISHSTHSATRHVFDEASFSKCNLATDSSVYFRRSKYVPNSIMWRVLNNRKLLELQFIDLTQPEATKTEALLTVQLHFPDSIRPFGIAFADPSDRDCLVAFVLTSQNDIYKIALPKDVFVPSKAPEHLNADWCISFSPPALKISDPYRLFAPSTDHLILSLADGRIVQLICQHHKWTESYFQTSALSRFRPIAKWKGQSFIPFEGTELNASAAVDAYLSPNEEYIITACLDHTLRFWSLSSGKIVFKTDLVDPTPLDASTQLQPHQQKFLLGPNQKQLLQIIEIPGRGGHKYYMTTFSPKTHEFSFWAVVAAEDGEASVERVQPDFEFTPPIEDLMDAASWNLEEFFVHANYGWIETKLWLRVRAGPVSRVFCIEFNLFDDIDTLEDIWLNQWTAVAAGRQSVEYLNLLAPSGLLKDDPDLHCPSATEKWLSFLFYPGRFTVETLETALHVFSKGITTQASGPSPKVPLKERLSHVVLTKASSGSSQYDLDLQEVLVSEQWTMFYGLVQELHKRRSTILSLAFDQVEHLAWIVSADMISPVRACTDLDICDFHRTAERNAPMEDMIVDRLSSKYEVSDLLQTAHVFRSLLTPGFQDRFQRIVVSEILQEPSASVRDRMLAMYNEANLAVCINQNDWERFSSILDDYGGYDILNFPNFVHILDHLGQEEDWKEDTTSGKQPPQIKETLTRYGARSLIRAAQESLELNLKTLLDLLLLTVFVEIEVDDDELTQSMQSPWRGQDIFVRLVARLKENAVLGFLMANQRVEKPRRTKSSADAENASQMIYTSTLMESLFIGDWSNIQSRPNLKLPRLINYWARRWMSSTDVLTSYSSFTEHIFAVLLKLKEDSLCAEFLPFLQSSFWVSYLKGKFHLSRSDFDKAAINFRKAAFGLSAMNPVELPAKDTAHLLRADENPYLCAGLPSYYEHVLNLFTQVKGLSYLVEFAQTAVQQFALEAHNHDVKQEPDDNNQPKAINYDVGFSKLLSRLFTAALDTAQYDTAYSALFRIPDAAIRKASLAKFATCLISKRQADKLVTFPFAALSSEFDSAVEAAAHQQLSTASSSTAAQTVSAPFFRALYALRIQNGDFRGAGQALWDYLQTFKVERENTLYPQDPQDQKIGDTYLMVINALRCCGQEEAWVLDDPAVAAGKSGVRVKFAANLNSTGAGASAGAAPATSESKAKKKRRVMFLADVRKEYQELLDQISDLEGGRFAFAPDAEIIDTIMG